MHCAYCGNGYHDEAAHCHGCGSPRSGPGYRGAEALYAKVGHALMTGEPNKSRALLEKIIGSPQTEPKRLWTERSAKVAMVIGLIYLFPTVALVLATMAMPFIIGVYLPYRGMQALFGWIRGTDARR